MFAQLHCDSEVNVRRREKPSALSRGLAIVSPLVGCVSFDAACLRNQAIEVVGLLPSIFQSVLLGLASVFSELRESTLAASEARDSHMREP